MLSNGYDRTMCLTTRWTGRRVTPIVNFEKMGHRTILLTPESRPQYGGEMLSLDGPYIGAPPSHYNPYLLGQH